MVLYPKSTSDFAIHCEGGRMRVYRRQDWLREHSGARPLFELTEAEGGALSWFLSYGLDEHQLKPGYQLRTEVDAEFGF